MDTHEFFPVKFYTFDNPELAEPMLEALQGEQRSLFNLPNMVETTKGNLHLLPEFAPLTSWIEECLDELKKENQYLKACQGLDSDELDFIKQRGAA